jgi:hypothetical protein
LLLHFQPRLWRLLFVLIGMNAMFAIIIASLTFSTLTRTSSHSILNKNMAFMPIRTNTSRQSRGWKWRSKARWVPFLHWEWPPTTRWLVPFLLLFLTIFCSTTMVSESIDVVERQLQLESWIWWPRVKLSCDPVVCTLFGHLGYTNKDKYQPSSSPSFAASDVVEFCDHDNCDWPCSCTIWI